MRFGYYTGIAGIAALLSLTDAGCGDKKVDCEPACAAGQVCDPSLSCVLAPPPDMAAAAPDLTLPVDMTMTCTPACAPGSYCSAKYHCVACLSDAHCPAGQICRAVGDVNICEVGCGGNDRCGVDGGVAMACCSGRCVDTSRDLQNCGGCGAACIVPHASGACAAGRCSLGVCDPHWGDCNGDPSDGCETNLQTDRKNCAACGTSCSLTNAVAGCADGCYLASCNYGWDDCDSDPATGCETSVIADPRNCGGCFMACPPVAHAKSGCTLGACQLSACDPGYGDCDGNAKNGCEVSTNTDANNCGKCGAACAQGLICLLGGCTCKNCVLANARTACINFQCVIASCLAGSLDCDGAPNNGCEINGQNDPKNCGACGVVCGGKTPFCQGGVCSDVSASCAGVLKSNPKALDGPYMISPDGKAPIQVYCDMSTDKGGWTIVYSTDGGDNEVGITSDTAVAGNGLGYAYSNLNQAQKIALSSISTESLFKRQSDGAWIKASNALFDGNLATPNSHMHTHVTLTASDGTSISASMGYANYNNRGGGDYGVSLFPDGGTCVGNTTDGFDHHSANYWHLNCGCQRQYLYSYSNNVADNDQSYNINTGLGAWTGTQVCASLEGGGLVFYTAMR